MGDQIISPCADNLATQPHHPHLTPASPAQQSQAARDPAKPLGRSLYGGLPPGPRTPRRAGSLPSLRSRTVLSLERAFRLAAPPREPRPQLCFPSSLRAALSALFSCLLSASATSKQALPERAPICRCVPMSARSRRVCWVDEDGDRTPLLDSREPRLVEGAGPPPPRRLTARK